MVHVEALLGVKCLLTDSCELHNVLYVLHFPYKLDRCRFTEKRLFQGQKITILSLEKQNISKKTLIRLLGAA